MGGVQGLDLGVVVYGHFLGWGWLGEGWLGLWLGFGLGLDGDADWLCHSGLCHSWIDIIASILNLGNRMAKTHIPATSRQLQYCINHTLPIALTLPVATP